MDNGTVAIKKVIRVDSKEEIKNSIFQLLDDMLKNGSILIPSNARILIKPNICLVKSFESGTTVDPFVVKCLVDWLIANFDVKHVYIGEADATALDIDLAFKVLGWEEVFQGYKNVELLNLSKDELVNVVLDNGLYFKNLDMSKSFMDADFLISVAKLKTHTMTTITGILKNQYGANPVKIKSKYHSKLDRVICDMNRVRLPDLCLVDGIIAMEGQGPVSGIPKPVGLLIAGDNAVATDHACARVMGFNPKKISHLKLAADQGLGTINYRVIGTSINDIATKFKLVDSWKKFITKVYQSNVLQRIPLWKTLTSKLFRS